MSNAPSPPSEILRETEYTDDELAAILETEDLGRIDHEKLAATAPARVARFFERLDIDERREVLRLHDDEFASAILAEMHAEDAAATVAAMRERRALAMIEEFDPDDAADVVGELEEEQRDRFLDKLEPGTAQAVRDLLAWPEDSAGGVMTTEVATVELDMSIDDAIDHLRKLHEEMEEFYYVYVVDDRGRLEGVVSMRDLILARPQQDVRTIMRTTLQGVCHPEEDREAVAVRMAEYNLYALPVVDKDGVILGIVTHDDVIDILTKEATEDFQKLVGAAGDESVHDPILYSVRHRYPWLVVNLLTAVAASGVIWMFRDKIDLLPMLAVVMPIVASMGGNAGAQTLAVTIRALALGEILEGDRRRLIVREVLMGLLNGLGTGLVAALVLFALEGDWRLGFVVLVAMIGTLALSGLSGAFIPLTLKKLKLDPAQSSSIFLTTVTDIAGFFLFLSLGSWLLLSG